MSYPNPTDEQVQDYIACGAGECPRCGSISITGEPFESEGRQSWQEVNCHECSYSWTDVYVLHHIEVTEPDGTLTLPQGPSHVLTDTEHDAVVAGMDVLSTMGCKGHAAALKSLLDRNELP